MTEYLFSYGTIQKKQVQLQLFGRVLKGSGDTLKGYRLSSIKIKDESAKLKTDHEYHVIANISNSGIDMIEGMVFEITCEEILLADKYEPDDYKRVKVELESGKKAWIYVAAKIT